MIRASEAAAVRRDNTEVRLPDRHLRVPDMVGVEPRLQQHKRMTSTTLLVIDTQPVGFGVVAAPRDLRRVRGHTPWPKSCVVPQHVHNLTITFDPGQVYVVDAPGDIGPDA